MKVSKKSKNKKEHKRTATTLLGINFKLVLFLKLPLCDNTTLSKKLLRNSKPTMMNSKQLRQQSARMVVFCMLGAQMERDQYLGLKRIVFGLEHTSTISQLDDFSLSRFRFNFSN